MHEARNNINDFEHKEAKNNQSHYEEERIQKNKGNISSLLDFKRSNIHIIGRARRREKEQEIGNLFEKIMKENFHNLMKKIDMQLQELQRVPN